MHVIAVHQVTDLLAPAVGVFWGINLLPSSVSLICVGVELERAEPYGQMLTYPHGHYELWKAWKALGAAGIRAAGLPPLILWTDYDDYPRGRVNFDTETKNFICFSDLKLQRDEIIDSIRRSFCLERETVVINSDGHYRT